MDTDSATFLSPLQLRTFTSHNVWADILLGQGLNQIPFTIAVTTSVISSTQCYMTFTLKVVHGSRKIQ